MQIISILLEAVIALLFAVSAVKGRTHLYGLAFTFGVHVYYDLVRQFAWSASEQTLRILFFLATLSALYAAWRSYKAS